LLIDCGWLIDRHSTQHSTLNQQSAISNQQSTLNQQSTIDNQQPINNPQSQSEIYNPSIRNPR
jgi:hypothetical protein